MEVFLLILRLALAGIFGLAGVAKFLDLAGSEKAFKEFGVPAAIAKPSSIALSVFEIAIAVLFLFTTTSWVAAVCALFLLVLFIGQMIYQMAKGNAPDCHCFGQIHSEPVGKISVIRNMVFAIPTAFLVIRGIGAQGMSLADPSLDVMQLVFGIASVAFFVTVLFHLKHISEQQRQIMRRLEIIELVAQEGGSVTRDEAGLPNEGLPIGAIFPDFQLPDLSGGVVALDDLKAERKPILFLFVSPTCNPCKALLPEFEQWQSDLNEVMKIVFLSNGSAEENAGKFAGSARKLILLQNEREVADAVKAQWTPTAILLDANGRIASHVAAGDGAIRELVENIKQNSKEKITYFTNHNGHSHGSKLGETIPQFSLADIHGNQISSDSFRGRETLVTFWSLTCPFCREMIAELRDWDVAKGENDPALVVFSEGNIDEHKDFGLKSPIILEEGFATAEKFGMYGTPSAVLVNEQGTIISETAGGASGIWALVGKKK
ncbi:MAG: redoxin domain-containing protein [Chloracidobacterium sp.]|nr:redoxin domain-containing protein [Chloracidobacterium sp.]